MQWKILMQLHKGCIIIRQFYSCSQILSVAGSSLVDTSEGLMQVKDLVNKNVQLISNGEVVSSKGFKQVKELKNLYKITTKNHYSITCSDNTRFLVQGQNKKELPYFKYLKQLQVGDAVYFNWGQSELYKFEDKVDQKAKDLGWVVGEIIGDGSHNPSKKRHSKAMFLCQNREVLAWHTYKIVNLHLPKSRQQLKRSKGPVRDVVRNRLTVQLKCLTDLCSMYITDLDKNIRMRTLKESKAFLMGLIQGFLDADGHINQTSSGVVLSNTNLHNITLVQSMLRWIGIISCISSSPSTTTYTFTKSDGSTRSGTRKKIYRLQISFLPQLLKYQEYISFNDPSKHKKLLQCIQNRKRFTSFNGFLQIKKIELVQQHQVQTEQYFALHESHWFGCDGFLIHTPLTQRNYEKQYSGVFVNRWQEENNVIRQKWERTKHVLPEIKSHST